VVVAVWEIVHRELLFEKCLLSNAPLLSHPLRSVLGQSSAVPSMANEQHFAPGSSSSLGKWPLRGGSSRGALRKEMSPVELQHAGVKSLAPTAPPPPIPSKAVRGRSSAARSSCTRLERGNPVVLASMIAWRVWTDNEKVLKTLFAGAVAGCVSRTCTSPLEVIATLQMSGNAINNGDILSQLGQLYREEGALGFFKGNGANCLKVAPSRAIQFAVYEKIKLSVLKQSQARARPGTDVSLSPYGRLCAGGLAGMVASSFVYPLEVVKTMLTVSPGSYHGIFDAFTSAYRDGGLQGFYTGWFPTLVAMFPYVGIEFMIYETFKKAYLRIQVKRGKSAALPPLIHLLLGCVAGMASQTSAHPLDVIRRRLQMQGKGGQPKEYHNMFDGLYKLVRDEGPAQLYRGLRPACLEKMPSTAITFFAYEVLKDLLGLRSV
jgi:solute carrier family 25 phosphate transporter 23/24/25/41